MFNGYGRWHLLTILALCNLVLWVAIAAMVGLLVSDRLDVGLETELREGRATVIAIWEGLSEQGLEMPGRPTAQLGGPQPTPTRPSTRQPQPTSDAGLSEPPPSPTDRRVDGLAATPSAVASLPPPASATKIPANKPSATDSSVGEPLAGQDEPASGQGTPAAAASPTPEPTLILLTKPLLLADPEFHSLTGLDAEMMRSAPGRVVQIRYQEAMLNQEIATLCENNPDLPFRNVHADLQRNQVVLTGEIAVLGMQVQAKVTGTVIARDCRPQIEIETISVAGVLTPQFVRNQIEQMVLDTMTWYPADYPLCLEQIVLEETKATLYGYHR